MKDNRKNRKLDFIKQKNRIRISGTFIGFTKCSNELFFKHPELVYKDLTENIMGILRRRFNIRWEEFTHQNILGTTDDDFCNNITSVKTIIKRNFNRTLY